MKRTFVFLWFWPKNYLHSKYRFWCINLCDITLKVLKRKQSEKNEDCSCQHYQMTFNEKWIDYTICGNGTCGREWVSADMVNDIYVFNFNTKVQRLFKFTWQNVQWLSIWFDMLTYEWIIRGMLYSYCSVYMWLHWRFSSPRSTFLWLNCITL